MAIRLAVQHEGFDIVVQIRPDADFGHVVVGEIRNASSGTLEKGLTLHPITQGEFDLFGGAMGFVDRIMQEVNRGIKEFFGIGELPSLVDQVALEFDKITFELVDGVPQLVRK